MRGRRWIAAALHADGSKELIGLYWTRRGAHRASTRWAATDPTRWVGYGQDGAYGMWPRPLTGEARPMTHSDTRGAS